MRRSALLPVLLLILLPAACGRDGSTAEPPTATAQVSSVATAAGDVLPPPKPTRSPARPATRTPAPPATSGSSLFGTQYAFLKSADLPNRRITFDLIEWFDSAAAVKACKADGEAPAENDWCTGWYIRNNNPKLRTLTVDPDAPLRLVVAGEYERVNLKKFTDGTVNQVIRFDVDGNRITKADHIYTP